MGSVVTPYKDKKRSKKEQVADMFDDIAPRYDLLNHVLSLGIDIIWRKKAIKLIKTTQPKTILDIATGTGDFAFEALKLNPEIIYAVDISQNMILYGEKKAKKIKGGEKVHFELGDSENLRFEDNSVDAITVGFGVRNFENLEKGLKEMHRVLRPGGKVAILEPSYPKYFPLKQLYFFYFRGILPFVGRLISGSKAAYTYLPESVKAFPDGKAFVSICNSCGFKEARHLPLSFGICSLYLLEK